jgi:cytosine deaminase
MPIMDLLIRNAKPLGEVSARDLALTNGRFVAVGDQAHQTIDAGGRLVVPGFVETHIHLDKVFLRDQVRPNHSGTLDEAIEIMAEQKRLGTAGEIAARAGRAIESAVLNGVTRIRTHVDVDNIGGLVPLEGVIAARERYQDIVDIQIVAFPQEGVLQNEGTEKLLKQAMERGADVVGGMPFNERSVEASQHHIEIMFDIAKMFDADIDMHIDETDDPNARTLEMLADATVRHSWEGRVSAGHACALAAYPDHHARDVIRKVKSADINVIMNPAVNMMLQGRHDAEPKRRGITRVRELLDAGVNVLFGQDCMEDVFYPFGRGDPLEVALIAAHATHSSQPAEIEALFAMPTWNAAKVMRVDDYGFQEGAPADLVILDASNPAEAIATRADRTTVIKRGQIVAQTTTSRRISRHIAP